MFDRLVDAAFEYAFPLYAVARTRHQAVADGANPRRHPPNTLQHERQLSDHTSRWITAPNNDTLYSNAWLDLSFGPVDIGVDTMPADRYWSIALMDAFTNHFAVIGQRDEGTGPVRVTLVGSDGTIDDSVDDGVDHGARRVVRAPGHDVWLFARCLVDGPQDLPTAHAMQDRLRLRAPAEVWYPPRVVPLRSTDPENFLAVVNEWLGRNPVPASEQALLDRWAVIGVRPGAADAWTTLGGDVRAAWTARIDAAHRELRAASARGRRVVQGWVASAPDMGDFGANFPLRASVALGGIGALPAQEAMYFVRFHDDATELLDGQHRYRLRVPPSGIPTDSFWSFSMYEPAADGQRFFAENPIQRYSIGNRTPGLVFNADGSLDIALQHDAPAEAAARANWLPAPAGPFQISLRTYLPRAELRNGTAALPRLVRV